MPSWHFGDASLSIHPLATLLTNDEQTEQNSVALRLLVAKRLIMQTFSDLHITHRGRHTQAYKCVRLKRHCKDKD